MLFFDFIGVPQAATQEEILKNHQNYPELEEYRQIFLNNMSNPDLYWPEKGQKIIAGYREFIKKYPRGEFTDEAKLRIAEFYELLFQKGKSLPFLNDIIKNHSTADYFSLYFSLNKKAQSAPKTAAWALYYRGLWFHRPDDWERILRKYPESREAAGLAKNALKKLKSK